MKNQSFSFIFALVSAGTTLLMAQTHAQTVITNFDLNSYVNGGGKLETYSGQGALKAGGTVFNGATDTNGVYTFINANDSTGASSSVGLTVKGTGSYGSNQTAVVATDPSALLGDFATANGGGTFTLSGLALNTNYSLYVYAANGSYADVGDTVTVTGGTIDHGTTNTGTTNVSLLTATPKDSTFVEGGNYLLFTGNTGAAGTVIGTFSGSGRTEGDLAGLQIKTIGGTPASAAPEPSGMLAPAFCALGLGALLLRARRKGTAYPSF